MSIFVNQAVHKALKDFASVTNSTLFTWIDTNLDGTVRKIRIAADYRGQYVVLEGKTYEQIARAAKTAVEEVSTGQVFSSRLLTAYGNFIALFPTRVPTKVIAKVYDYEITYYEFWCTDITVGSPRTDFALTSIFSSLLLSPMKFKFRKEEDMIKFFEKGAQDPSNPVFPADLYNYI